MKKVFIYCFTLVVMCSCNITPAPRYETVEIDLPIENFINDFLSDNPNFFNNAATMESGNQDFIKGLSDTLNTSEGRMNLFDGIPLRLKTINKTKELGYVAQFDSWIEPAGFIFHYVSDINFDVFCAIPDSIVPTLKEDEYYILDGTYAGNLTYNECVQCLGKITSVYNPIVGIEKDNSFHIEYYQRKVNLGCMLVLFEDIKPYVSRETKTIKIETR